MHITKIRITELLLDKESILYKKIFNYYVFSGL